MVYIGRLAGVSPRSSHSIPLCVLRLDSYAENDVALVRPCRQKHPHRTPHAKAPSSTGAGGVALGFILRECTNLVLALDRCYDAKIYIYIYIWEPFWQWPGVSRSSDTPPVPVRC